MEFNLHLHNHRKDIQAKDPKFPSSFHFSSAACRHFKTRNHTFNKHTKFTLIEQLLDLNSTSETLTQQLIQREDFWIIKLKTLLPNGLNHELNFPNMQ